MDESVLRFRVGVVVVAAVVVTVVLIMLFGAWPNVLQSQYLLHIRFPEAPGVTAETPVRKSGVLIGRVTEVKLLDEGGVLVTTRINSRFTLRRDETCRIGSDSLLGDAILEFVPSAQEELLTRFDNNKNRRLDAEEEQLCSVVLADEDYLADGTVARNPLRALVNLEGSISDAFASIKVAGNEVSNLAKTVNQKLDGDDGRVARLMDKTEKALDGLQQASQILQKVLGDEQLTDQLRDGLRELPAFVQEARQTMTAARTTMEDFQRVSGKAEANLDNLEQLTRPLGQRGEQLVRNVEESTENLNRMLVQFTEFSERLNSGEGTLGRLVRDDEVYLKIQSLLENAEELSVRLKPIVEDVRIFTDKIARDPGQLGVRGALDRKPTGLKTGVTW
jgi:phospholipid/cholesterol/gamma-HCH transport system substrate-binding protein